MADRRAEENAVTSGPQNKSIEDFDPPMKPKTSKFAIACALLACTTSVLLGYDIGVMSGASLFIKKNLNISDVQVEVLAGTLNIYSLVGSAFAGRTSDWIGRKYTIVLAGVIFLVGALLMGFATNYAFLMVGRFVAGVGVGYGMMIAPVYTAEISPASFRGFLTSFPEMRMQAPLGGHNTTSSVRRTRQGKRIGLVDDWVWLQWFRQRCETATSGCGYEMVMAIWVISGIDQVWWWYVESARSMTDNGGAERFQRGPALVAQFRHGLRKQIDNNRSRLNPK